MKSRFCPSPTGLMHIGNVRTALFNYLAAKSKQGDFLLRVEDTDRERSKPEFTDAIKTDLTWLGLAWDEGPDHEQGRGPYFQSERQSVYDQYYGVLEEKGLAYPCFCSEKELAIARKIQLSSGKPPRYSGTCRHLTQEQVQEKIAAGLAPTLRFRVPDGETVRFIDGVRGEQQFNTDDIGDFIIRRANGTSPFMFCNAVDDALMGVTDALRGEDHLTNTPRQLMMLGALGLHSPTYHHISLIMGHDGSPLSKRHGSKSIQHLREEGYLAIALVNYMARLGHVYSQSHLMSHDELAEHFNFAALTKAPARYDEHQLHHWQKEAVAQLAESDFWAWAGDEVYKLVPLHKHALFYETVRHNVIFPKEVLAWAEIFFGPKVDVLEESMSVLQAAGADYLSAAIDAVKNTKADYQACVNVIKDKTGCKGKALFQPLRIALTGHLHGPEMAPMFRLLEIEGVVNRLEQAYENL